MEKQLEILAKGRTGKVLLEVLDDLKRKVADIRTPMKIKSEIQNEVRLGIIEIVDSELINKLKIFAGVVEPQDPNEFE